MRALLQRFKEDGLGLDEVLSQLRGLPYQDLDFAKVDHHRSIRKGFPEVVFGEGKTAEQVVRLFLKEVGYRVLDEDEVFWEDTFPELSPGTRLRAARSKEGKSQAWLAERAGVPQRHISEMENDKRPIGKANAQKFGETLNISYKVFL